MEITYCKCCVMPETKPGLYINGDGVCSGCVAYLNREEVDWIQREKELLHILEKHRSPDGTNYDCIIPVSGGKDSHYQTLKLLEYGFNPLLVTATTDSLTPVGRRNIDNLMSLGVDYLEVTTNKAVRRSINRIALQQVGDISWPEHVTIFTIPVRVATQLGIKLIIWGENANNENGGPATNESDNVFDRRYLEEFGGLNGLRVSDLADSLDIDQKHLIQYTYPSDEALRKTGVTGLFLGYFLPWDGATNAFFSQAHGFETYPTRIGGQIVNFENLDNYQARIHDYFKFLKYGFDRCTDWACLYIRRGRLTREQGLALVAEHGGKYPTEYLGEKLEKTLADISMTIEEFDRICDQFTNNNIFVRNATGELARDSSGNLIKINADNN